MLKKSVVLVLSPVVVALGTVGIAHAGTADGAGAAAQTTQIRVARPAGSEQDRPGHAHKNDRAGDKHTARYEADEQTRANLEARKQLAEERRRDAEERRSERPALGGLLGL